jgi:NADH:ubiquinone oxidoreductase subunit 5 (subunit L)/multisubunit Na+/H+ antiporter MnhA subunit
MSAEVNPTATHHLPIFITPPGETDVLMVITAVFLLVAVVAFGLLFLRLHSLPERLAHRGHKLQFEIVAVLCLIALFTHIHAFWIAALLLALVEIPDFGSLLARITRGVERIAGIKPSEASTESPPAGRRAEVETDEHLAPVARASGEAPRQRVEDEELSNA